MPQEIKEKVYVLAKLMIKNEELLEMDLKTLCAAGIAFLRQVHGITPAWNEELEIISGGLTLEKIQPALDSLGQKFSLEILDKASKKPVNKIS